MAVALVAPAARASASNRQKVVSRTLFFSSRLSVDLADAFVAGGAEPRKGSLASDATLSWTVGPADATAYFDALRSGEVAFAIETTRSGAASVAVAFQSKESDGAMFPADAVLAWLDFEDAATGFVGSYALSSYDADAGVVGPENEKLNVYSVSVERRRVDDEKTSLIARFVAKTDDVAAALGVADAFVGESETSSGMARVAYAIGSVPGKAYHDLGRGSVLVNLHVGGDGERFVSKSATLKRKRFQAHAGVALGAFGGDEFMSALVRLERLAREPAPPERALGDHYLDLARPVVVVVVEEEVAVADHRVRRGVAREDITALRAAFLTLKQGEGTFTERAKRIGDENDSEYVQQMVSFIMGASDRNFLTPK